MGRNILFLICLLCCNVDISELSLHFNTTDINWVVFYTTQKICNLSSFSALGSYLICVFTTGPKSMNYNMQFKFSTRQVPPAGRRMAPGTLTRSSREAGRPLLRLSGRQWNIRHCTYMCITLDRGRSETGENLMFCEWKHGRIFKKTTSIVYILRTKSDFKQFCY